jgi:GWxTD domain-containing protein
MNKRTLIIYLFFIMFLGSCAFYLFPKTETNTETKSEKKQTWKQWLREVDVIMTELERSVAKKLKTEEEHERFIELFWRARNPEPKNPVNQFQMEFYKRLHYADTFYGGPHTDRGKIYILLGNPENKSTFSGSEMLIECEVWSYEGKDIPGLPPYINLIFYKPRDLGDFQLFQPGMNKPRELLSPMYYDNVSNAEQVHKYLKMSSIALASASLSVIPGEGETKGNSIGSSALVLNRIYSIPETEAEAGYVRNFVSTAGTVEVSHSTRAIRGFGYITVARNKGIPFIHYALMPDMLNVKTISQNSYSAAVNLNINIEDLKGNVIFQDSRQIDFDLDPKKKQTIDSQKIVFLGFAPIIEGDFNIILTFINKVTEEFFTYEEKITVPGFFPMLGFQLKEAASQAYIPFSADKYRVAVDPRFMFSQKDTLTGIVASEGIPGIVLEKENDKSYTVPIPAKATADKQGNLTVYTFEKPLGEIKDGKYLLAINNPGEIGGGKTITRPINILPFYIDLKKPLGMEKPEPARSENNYIFVQGQEYLAAGKLDRAIEYFNKLPLTLWNNASIPVIARAYYKKGDYAKVVELLEKDIVKKEYPVLLMLANSSIELKSYSRAITYLEQLRNYGDTVEVNQLMASTYLCMGNREKATVFYERARDLKNKKQKEKNKEKNKE